MPFFQAVSAVLLAVIATASALHAVEHAKARTLWAAVLGAGWSAAAAMACVYVLCL